MNINVLQKLNVFNNDTSFRKLKEKYSAPSFFEIVDISRDESRHSAFLKWLLQGTEIVANKQFIPLMGLLDALIERDGPRDKEQVIETKVKNAIASRSITISNIKAKCEQSIGKLGVVEKSKDRIDQHRFTGTIHTRETNVYCILLQKIYSLFNFFSRKKLRISHNMFL